MDLTLKCPFTMLISGVSKCGKTSFCFDLMKAANLLYSKAPGENFFFYNMWQPLFKENENLVTEFKKGLPSREWLSQCAASFPNATIFIDDLGQYASDDTAEIFTVASSHLELNIIWLQHSLFSKNPAVRMMSLNTTYLIVFKTVRDKRAFSTLAHQMYPNKHKTVVKIFEAATKEPFSYLLLDFSMQTDEKMRLRSHLLKWPMRIYMIND